jgi:hypothetical protein
LGSRHTYKLLIKTALPKPASHTILHWEALKFLKSRNRQSKTFFEKPHHALYQRYKCYRLFLRLRKWQIANAAESLIEVHYAQIKRNPE